MAPTSTFVPSRSAHGPFLPYSGPTSSAAAAASSAAAAPCTTNSCIVTELDQSLVGAIAQDESVATKVKCENSTVKNEGNGNYTAWCTVDYSDGTSVEGYGNVDTSQNKVTFQPSD